MTGTITINGTLSFAPKSVKISYDSLASPDSGRTDDGVMHITYIKSKLQKLTVTLPTYSTDDTTYTDVLATVQGQTYTITYEDESGSSISYNAYTSNSSADVYSGVLHGGLISGA